MLPPSSGDHCNTPPPVLEVVLAMGPIRLDPCSNLTSIVKAAVAWRRVDDGLSRSWLSDERGVVYVNPPYHKDLIGQWVRKCAEEASAGCEIILLVPARTEQAWFLDHVLPHAAAICFWRGRIKFLGQRSGARFPSALVYYGPRPRHFRQMARRRGRTVILNG